MKFERIEGTTVEVSDCGRYTVVGAYVLGVMTFQGWRRPLFAGKPGTLLTRNRVVTEATARAHCVADAKRIARETKPLAAARSAGQQECVA